MASGAYDNPNHQVRSYISALSVAGANGTSGYTSFPHAMRLRNVRATVRTAGTSATGGNAAHIFVGTASVGTIALGTGAAGTGGTSGDLNTLVPAGTNIALKNGTDATGVCNAVFEVHSDPTTGTWS